MNSMAMRRFLFQYLIILLSCFYAAAASAQVPDSIYKSNILTIRFHNYGDQLSLPLINLNGGDQVELHFDDIEGGIKYYYYTYLLCDHDWNPVILSEFDYLKGFTQMRINTYRNSSLAFTRYTHYQAILPERNCIPSRSGNYLLKVFLDGDTSKLVFTRRLLVLENKSTIKAQIIQPFAPEYFHTHQKVQFSININGVNAFSANQDIKVIILQNYRWDNAIANIVPTFIRGSSLEYNTEDNSVFPGGKEWRWLDLRDFRLQSDRVESADYKKNSTEIYLKPDIPRNVERYTYYRDMNGMYLIETTQSINPFWQSDYGTVHFKFDPPNGKPYFDKDLYLFGQLTNYKLTDSLKLAYNPEKGIYETKLLLKEGYYNYTYVAVDRANPYHHYEIDGDYYETENTYTILVYYRSFTARADELIGVSTIDSRTDRPGFSF